jgi:hypothetical protein
MSDQPPVQNGQAFRESEVKLLNANQFGFRARYNTTLQCMRLADHVTLNFNNKMSTAAVFFDIE